MKTSALALLALLCILPVFAHAQTALKWNEDQVSWSAPTACSEGSPLADCPISGYRVERAAGSCAGTWSTAGTTAANILTFKVGSLVAGTNCYRVITLSAGTSESLPSAAKSQVTTPPTPGAPTNVTVSDVVAYEIRSNAQGVLTASRIGIVPAGSLCSQDAREIGGVTYNRIDPASVDLINWPAGLPPKDVFAKCGS